MNFHSSFRNILSIFCVLLAVICCTEQPIDSDFESNLTIETLTINNLNISNYSVAPNLATNERLYVGEKNGIKIMGESNILNKLPVSASSLYAKNTFNFVENLFDKENKKLNINLQDEIIEKTLIK